MTTVIEAIEREVIAALVQDALAAGYSLSVYDGGAIPLSRSSSAEAVMAALFSVDDEELYFNRDGRRVGWVRLIHNNDGWDVIADYTTNLEPIMAGANAVSEKYQ